MNFLKKDQGFSLVEILIASAIFIGLLLIVSGSMQQLTKAQKQIESRSIHQTGYALFNRKVKSFGTEKRSDFFDKQKTVEDLIWVNSSRINISKYTYSATLKSYLAIADSGVSSAHKNIYLSSSVVGKRILNSDSDRLEKKQTEIAVARCLSPGQKSLVENIGVTQFVNFIHKVKFFPVSIKPTPNAKSVIRCCQLSGNTLDCRDVENNFKVYTFFANFDSNNMFKTGMIMPAPGERNIEGLGFFINVESSGELGENLLFKTFSLNKCDKKFKSCNGGKQVYLAKEKEWNSEFNATIQGSSLFPIN